MGWVFLAFDGDLGRRVAIKWLKPAGGEALERLAREAHLHARVEHPAVCRLYHLGDHQGRPYLVLQLVRGETLDKAAPRLPVPVRVRLVATLADGVHAAHRQGLVHRDLKPANCMVEMDEAGHPRPYVMDFGLAREEASHSRTGAGFLAGSPAYMAPEQVKGAWTDPRTDVYGLGALLFETLTGRPPFLGAQVSQLLLQVATEDAPRLRSLDPSLPRDLETVVATCLAKDPARRYPSAAALRDDLLRFLDGRPLLARREGLPGRQTRAQPVTTGHAQHARAIRLGTEIHSKRACQQAGRAVRPGRTEIRAARNGWRAAGKSCFPQVPVARFGDTARDVDAESQRDSVSRSQAKPTPPSF
jgi:serine/threonine-protein kinase